MERFVRIILRWRWLVLALVVLLTGAALASLSRAVVASSIGGMFLGESEDYRQYLQRVADFGGSDVLVVAVEDPNPLSQDRQDMLRRAVEGIGRVEAVKTVRSILDVQRVRGDAEALHVDPYAALAASDPAKIPELQRELRNDPLGAGLLIADGGCCHAVAVEIDTKSDVPAEQGPQIVADVLAAFTAAGYDPATLHAAGFPASVAAIITETYFTLKQLLPFVIVVLLVTVWLMFRRLWPVALTMTVAALASLWTMGLATAINPHVSVLTAMVPAVILIISFSDVIHLCSAYLLELGRGLDKDAAIFASATDVGRACLLTSLTTFFGFVAMSFVPAPVFREMGVILGFGVAIALLLAVTLTPILFSLIPEPKPWRQGAVGSIQDGLDRVLVATHRATSGHPWWFIAGFGALLVVAGIGATRFTIETNFAKRLADDHPARVDNEFVAKHFDGANAIDVFITAAEPDGLLDPEFFARVARFQQAVKADTGVAGAVSLVDLMAIIHREMNAGQAAATPPQTRAALAQYLLLFEASGGADLDRLIDFDRRTMRVAVQVPDEGVRATTSVGRRIADHAAATLGDSAQVEVSGVVYLLGDWLDEMLAGQRRGLLFAVLTIAVTMMLGLRSWRVGLWSMIPNLLPLVVLAGYLGWTQDGVDSDVMALAMIAIGIGVDDTIHFLSRLRVESRRQADVEQALERTLYFSGRGIIITTVILVAGFAPFATADYVSHFMMGTLLPLTLIVALAADLFLVPALARIGLIRF